VAYTEKLQWEEGWDSILGNNSAKETIKTQAEFLDYLRNH